MLFRIVWYHVLSQTMYGTMNCVWDDHVVIWIIHGTNHRINQTVPVVLKSRNCLSAGPHSGCAAWHLVYNHHVLSIMLDWHFSAPWTYIPFERGRQAAASTLLVRKIGNTLNGALRCRHAIFQYRLNRLHLANTISTCFVLETVFNMPCISDCMIEHATFSWDVFLLASFPLWCLCRQRRSRLRTVECYSSNWASFNPLVSSAMVQSKMPMKKIEILAQPQFSFLRLSALAWVS